MYKVASELNQRRARQLWLPDLLGKDFERLSLKEQVSSLKAASRSLLERLEGLAEGPTRRKISAQRHEISTMLSELKPKVRRAPGVENRFMDVAREKLSSFQFKLMLAEATRRAEEDEQALREMN